MDYHFLPLSSHLFFKAWFMASNPSKVFPCIKQANKALKQPENSSPCVNSVRFASTYFSRK